MKQNYASNLMSTTNSNIISCVKIHFTKGHLFKVLPKFSIHKFILNAFLLFALLAFQNNLFAQTFIATEFKKAIITVNADAVTSQNTMTHLGAALGKPFLGASLNSYDAKIDADSDFLVRDLTNIIYNINVLSIYWGSDDAATVTMLVAQIAAGTTFSNMQPHSADRSRYLYL